MRLASRRLVQFRRARGGATAIEFALVALPFFLVVGCTFEMGVILAREYTLQNAVQDAGRTIRTGNAGEMSGNGFIALVCSEGAGGGNCENTLGISVQSGATFEDLDVPNIADIGPGVESFNPGGPGQAVAVVATQDWQFIFPFMGRFFSNLPDGDARRLHGITVFRNEPT